VAFRLNGIPCEQILGRSADDPLIRLLTRGPGAYRMAAKALQYALQRPSAHVESSSSEPDGPTIVAIRLEGLLRSTGEPFESRCVLSCRREGDRIVEIDVEVPESDLARIARAREG
jgi:hypothetical protein